MMSGMSDRHGSGPQNQDLVRRSDTHGHPQAGFRSRTYDASNRETEQLSKTGHRAR